MYKRLPFWLVLFALGALATLRAQAPATAAPMPAGQIVAAKVLGVVTMSINGAAAVALKNGDPVPEHASISTARESSIVLVFSNGATTQLGADTQLAIEQFLQDPFSAQISPADLTDEPTTSRTKLKLTHGELVGNVKHLKQDKGSTFVIDTPVGAAGIRGTTFRIVFRPDSTGLAFSFSLSTVEGNVNFQQSGTGGTGGNTGTPGTVSTGGVAVPSGQEVVVTVNVETNPTTGAVTVSTPVVVSNTTSISTATMQAVLAQASTSATAAATVTFTPGGTGGTGGSGTGTGTGTSGDGTGTGSKFTGTGTTSGATSTGTDLTPGDGTTVH